MKVKVMKIKIAKRMVLPLLYGLAAGWIVAAALAVMPVVMLADTPVIMAAVSVSVVILLALLPCLRHVTTVYGKALKYHKAEYLYNLGNGVEASEAVGMYERKVKKTAVAWLQRKMLRSSFAAFPVSFFMLLAAGVDWITALELVVLVAIAVLLAVVIGMMVMLYTARHHCYDKFGNIKNN